MKKVFCITCHEINNALIYTVNYFSSFDENVIFIHVDAKSNIDDFNVIKNKNVHFLKDRLVISWGGINQIKSTIRLLKEALTINFDYLFFISGDDVPCKTNSDMDIFLSGIDLKNLVHFQDVRNSYVNPDVRVKYNYPKFFFAKNKTMLNKIKAKLFKILIYFFLNAEYKSSKEKGMSFYKGTSWFSLNHTTVTVLMDFINNNSWYLSMFEKSFCGDEVFFHTALKYIGIEDIYHDERKINDALRYIDWSTGPDYPRVLDESDVEKIKREGCLFARKFNNKSSSHTYERLLK